jgi:D-alanyl-D-alanine carboxypeptidase/D-alanyl-D-alanine-endopeptidase (penicillin-binding protein 4)
VSLQRRPARLLALALALALSGPALHAQASPRGLAQRIERITSRPEFRHALWGIEVYSLDTRRPLYTVNADKLFVPGSTTKLLTEGSALGLLGADHRFHTPVYRTGPIAPDGTLDGDLVLVASGDPNLSGRITHDSILAFENHDHSYGGDTATRAVPGDPLLVVRALARQVSGKGIKRVLGRVIVDASLFPEGERELGTGVVISPIVVNDNVIDVTVTPGADSGAPAAVQRAPITAYARFVNQAKTGAPGSRSSIDWTADSTAPDGTHIVTIGGTIPARSKPLLYSYAVPSPSKFAEVVLTEALREVGVQVQTWEAGAGPGGTTSMYTPDHLVAEHVSPPLREEIKVTLKVSQNLHASETPLLLGAVVGKGDTARTGFDLEREFLTRAKLDLTGAQQGDGAGGNAHFTPAFMVSYLAYMASRPDYRLFLAALPVLGRDGTLSDIQPHAAAAGHVFAKTGTYFVGDPLNRRGLVTGKGLAGYVTTPAGHHLAFAAYINNVSVADEPDAIKQVAGQALGEVAAAIYDAGDGATGR